MPIFCLPSAESSEFCVVDDGEHADMIQSDGADIHHECYEVELVESRESWRGVYLAAEVVRTIASYPDIDFDLTDKDEKVLEAEDEGEMEIVLDGETVWVSDYVTSLYEDADLAACSAGYITETWDGWAMFRKVEQ